MSSLIVTPPKTSGETKQILFDFLSQLRVGETISSASAVCTTWSGTDLSPGSVISGLPSVSGSQVWVRVTGGVNGNVYMITVTANTSLSNHPVIQTYLAVVNTPL